MTTTHSTPERPVKDLRLNIHDDLREKLMQVVAISEKLPIPLAQSGVSDSMIIRSCILLLDAHFDNLRQEDAERYAADLHRSDESSSTQYPVPEEMHDQLVSMAQRMYDQNWAISYLKAGRGWNKRVVVTIAIAWAAEYGPQIVEDWRKDATTDPQSAGAPRRDT